MALDPFLLADEPEAKGFLRSGFLAVRIRFDDAFKALDLNMSEIHLVIACGQRLLSQASITLVAQIVDDDPDSRALCVKDITLNKNGIISDLYSFDLRGIRSVRSDNNVGLLIIAHDSFPLVGKARNIRANGYLEIPAAPEAFPRVHSIILISTK